MIKSYSLDIAHYSRIFEPYTESPVTDDLPKKAEKASLPARSTARLGGE